MIVDDVCNHGCDHTVFQGSDGRWYAQCCHCFESMQLPECNYRLPFPADYKPVLTEFSKAMKVMNERNSEQS